MGKLWVIIKATIAFARENWTLLGAIVAPLLWTWLVVLDRWRKATREDIEMTTIAMSLTALSVLMLVIWSIKRGDRFVTCFWPYESGIGKFTVRLSTGRVDAVLGVLCPKCRGQVLDADYLANSGAQWICASKACGWKSPDRYWRTALGSEAMKRFMDEQIENGQPILKSTSWPSV